MLEQPRGDMTGWDEYNDNIAVPNNALKLSNAYILDNQFGGLDGSVNDVGYSFDNPIRNFWQSNDVNKYEEKPDANHGYAALYSDNTLRQGINNVASEFGIPGRWLSDSVAMLTRGTFDTYHQSGYEASGLISKTPKQIAELGVSPYAYGMGDVSTQVEAVRQQLNRVPRDVLQKGAEYVLTGLMNHEVAQEVAESPRMALKLNNGVYTLYDIWNGLGSHQDIAYDHSLNEHRKNRMLPVHDHHVEFCATCRALKRSNSAIIPHEGYRGT